MIDDKDNKADFMEKFTKDEEIAKRKRELEAKKINNAYERMIESENEIELAKSGKFGSLTAEQIEKLAGESEEYLSEARSSTMKFINEKFDRIVPFFRKTLVLIGAETGYGKSTCVANIVRTVISEINPRTGKGRRALVITNEENAVDFYNRVTCLVKGWHYIKHNEFKEEHSKTFSEWIKMLAKDGRLTVIDDNYEVKPGISTGGVTTTVEGIETIFENLMRDKEYYDVVILDYYQNVMKSNKDPTLDEYVVQRKLTQVLEKYRKIYPAPIVVMCQVNAPSEEKSVPFKLRMLGTKIITTKATVTLEMIKDAENLRTEWLLHKGRFSESVGQGFFTGYDNGKFVKYDVEFMKKVESIKEQRTKDSMIFNRGK